MRLLDFYTTQILTSTTVVTERIGWLLKVTDNNDARWKPEVNCAGYIDIYLRCKFYAIRIKQKSE